MDVSAPQLRRVELSTSAGFSVFDRVAILYVVFDRRPHTGPPVVKRYQVVRTLYSRVSAIENVMIFPNDVLY
jgi:hypothetical protein